jgi:uncharacterized membrane protein
MCNDIPAKQNQLVGMVRASREVYRCAKMVGFLQLVLSLISAIGGPTIVAIVSYFNSAYAPATKGWVGLFAIVTILTDLLFLEPWVKKLQETGARIQEQFDTSVYDLPWNKVRAGDRIDAGTLHSLVTSHEQRYPKVDGFLDWYPTVVGQVPMTFARLICQWSSIQWDASLRNFFCLVYTIGIFAILLGALVYAMAAGYDMQAVVLSVFMPLLPAVLQVYRERGKNAEAAADMQRASSHLNGLWERLLEGTIDDKEAEHQSRLIQDELFDRRRRAPAIPEQLYQFTRSEYEEKMKKAANEKVEEVKKRRGPFPDTKVGVDLSGP